MKGMIIINNEEETLIQNFIEFMDMYCKYEVDNTDDFEISVTTDDIEMNDD